MSDTASPPLEDAAELRARLQRAEARLRDTEAELSAARSALRHRDAQLERLRLQLATLRRMQFGRSSEKLAWQIEQLELQLEELETPTSEDVRVERAESRPRRKPARRALPPHLPRETVTHAPQPSCPSCGGELRAAGEDVSEVLEYVPARFKVIRHVRPKCACARCQRIVQAPAPERPVPRGLAGPGLLAQVLVSKYADHLPLYRQSEIYAREGVELERSTLADWVGQASALLAPLGEALGRYVRGGPTLHADDTPVPVLAPGLGRTRTGRLWTYVRDERPAGQVTPPAVWLRYSPDRKGIRPQAHLSGYEGVLHADGYAGFHHLYATGRIKEAACWAHVRRKFYDIAKACPAPVAEEAVERIGVLYQIERALHGESPEVRRQGRQTRAGPVLAQLKDWLQSQAARVSAKSALGQAIGYTLSRWPALSRYAEDGRIEIDNNAAERALRTVALGRKNYLFAGSDAGGERAALIYSLIGTAKLNGLDPQAYLAHVIGCINAHPINRLEALLPWNVAPLLAARSAEAA